MDNPADTIDRIFKNAGYNGYRLFLDSSGYDPFMAAAYYEKSIMNEKSLLGESGSCIVSNRWLSIWVEHDPSDFIRRGPDVYRLLGYKEDQIFAVLKLAMSRVISRLRVM
jgi:hypothetical protein